MYTFVATGKYQSMSVAEFLGDSIDQVARPGAQEGYWTRNPYGLEHDLPAKT
jgi:hypothetical protein